MKASEIQVGGWYEVNHNGIHRVGKCTAVASKPALYTFVTPDNEVIELTNGRYIMSACSAAPAQPTIEPTLPEVMGFEPEPAYTARPINQPHDCGLSSEGREAEAEREASELAYREWLAAQPVEPTPEPEVEPVELVETEAPVSGPSATIHVALEAEWAAVDAPTYTEPGYTDDELSLYESRWLAAISDTPPADQPPTGELGSCEVVELERNSDNHPDHDTRHSEGYDDCYPDDINFGGMGASDLPPRSPGVERGQTRARVSRPRWARAQAKQRLLAGVR